MVSNPLPLISAPPSIISPIVPGVPGYGNYERTWGVWFAEMKADSAPDNEDGH